MSDKYGLPLTGSDWAGLPMRLGNFPGAGKVEELRSACDTVLFWSGDTAEVTIDSSPGTSDTISRRKFVRRSGMIDLLPQGTLLHQVSWRGGAQRCVSVNLPQACVQQLLGVEADSGLEEGLRLGVVDSHVADLVSRLETQVELGLPLGPAYAQALSMTLATYVAARYGSGAPQATAHNTHYDGPLPAQQRQALEAFIEEHLDRNVGLVDLSAVVGYSPDHFSRLFKRAYGLSPYQYVLARRVERAKALLNERKLSIAEVAVTCGFASQPHLNEVFKRLTGLTPGAFRKG